MLNRLYGYAIFLCRWKIEEKKTVQRNETVLFRADGEARFFFQYLHKVEIIERREKKNAAQLKRDEKKKGNDEKARIGENG